VQPSHLALDVSIELVLQRNAGDPKQNNPEDRYRDGKNGDV
jgi:hypothetical protein